MVDWTPEAIEAAHRAMFQEPYDGTTAAMIGAGLDAAAAAQGMQEDNALREENARLREALKTFALKAPVQLTYEGRDFIKAIPVSESELEAARDALKEPGDEKTGI